MKYKHYINNELLILNSVFGHVANVSVDCFEGKKPTCSMQNKILKTFAVCSLGFLIHCGSVGTFKCVG